MKKHLITISDLSKNEIIEIFKQGKVFKDILQRPIKKIPTLRGKTVGLLFFEPSTRTKLSFELAAKRMSADTINFSASTSSLKKNESIKDTIMTLEAMKIDIYVVRHPSPGVPAMITKIIKGSVINAGDGAHAHPTQGILDAYTVWEKFGDVKGLHIAILGDVKYSRVIRSDIEIFLKLGAHLTLCTAKTLMPNWIDPKVKYTTNIEKAVKDADVIMGLRMQKERQDSAIIPDEIEFNTFFGIKNIKIANKKNNYIVMHPGPINRGIEIDGDIADSKHSVINEQVTNGLATRMAIFYALFQG
ncbi:aspartate carbamoyltransferase catalytic subunit [bacterium]|nr:aspartate carbamoyltransferase catalytic subunit [bacterium]